MYISITGLDKLDASFAAVPRSIPALDPSWAIMSSAKVIRCKNLQRNVIVCSADLKSLPSKIPRNQESSPTLAIR
eukprot:12227224-Ditylum_brightwellii.AAC.1